MSLGPSIKAWLVSRAEQYSSASVQHCTLGAKPAGMAKRLNACCCTRCEHLHATTAAASLLKEL